MVFPAFDIIFATARNPPYIYYGFAKRDVLIAP